MEDFVILKNKYEKIKSENKKFDMSRGKPAPAQLDTVEKLLGAVTKSEDCVLPSGVDCRNYGGVDGLPQIKSLFAEILGMETDEIIISGNSSLNIMFDTVARAMLFGTAEGEKPWMNSGKISFLCPVPGYDRHFAICEAFGINMINVPYKADGPDMDIVEKAVAEDESIKGIWCVPKYSNPTGITYSDEVVRRFAALKPKAKDFRVFWDNAYVVHDLYDGGEKLLSVFDEAKKQGNEDLFYIFSSTSKISYAGAGISAFASSKKNIDHALTKIKYQTIGPDKINQLRHAKLYPNLSAVMEQMERHAEIIRPKFDAVLSAFEKELSDIDGLWWSKPKGGYFISLNLPHGKAKKVVALSKDAGLVLTPAGASFPYGVDPEDTNIRIAPTYPTLPELEQALELLCTVVKMVCSEGYED
jgi:DNA-binding transcriptional MocR family regulator